MGMPKEMTDKIDTILETVKEPETDLSMTDLQLVKKISWSEKEKRFLITMDIAQPRSTCLVCGVVTEQIRAGIERRLEEAFIQAFPGNTVEFA